ncbi:MAG: LytR/AlgR family response regulator transcription factor [Salibacteraceae bacterium]
MSLFKISTYLLDDEPLAIDGLQALIESKHSDFFNIVGKNTNPAQAIEEIEKLKPQLLFIDVEMPGYKGFEVLERLNYKVPTVVFVTAYDHFAIKAFDVDASDYLLKPIDPIRFSKTLEKIVSKSKGLLTYSENEESEQPKLFNQNHHEDSLNKKIGVLARDGYHLIHLSEINYIKADNNYSEFYLESGKKMVHSKNLKSVEEFLPKASFLRVSRFAIIRIDCIKIYNSNDGGFFVLKDGSKHSLGHTYKKELKNFIKEKYLG